MIRLEGSKLVRVTLAAMVAGMAVLSIALNGAAHAAPITPKTGLYVGSTSQGDNMAANFKVLKKGGGLVVGANIFLRVACPDYPPSPGAVPLRSKGVGDQRYARLGNPVPVKSGKFLIERTIHEHFVGPAGEKSLDMRVRITGNFTSAKVVVGTVSLLEWKEGAYGSIPAHSCPSIEGVTYTSRHP